jgi:hypothetical protein
MVEVAVGEHDVADRPSGELHHLLPELLALARGGAGVDHEHALVPDDDPDRYVQEWEPAPCDAGGEVLPAAEVSACAVAVHGAKVSPVA